MGPWLSIKPEITPTLSKRIYSSEILITDLDDTIAPSPAKKIAKSCLFRPKYLKNPEFHKWCLDVLKTKLKEKERFKDSETKLWERFSKIYSKDPQELEKIADKYTPEFAEQSLYKGVKEFYELLSKDMIKLFVTRDLKEVANAYTIALNFSNFLAEQFDKKRSIKNIIRQYPNLKRFIFKGDSIEDEAALDYLKFLRMNKKIDDVLSIYVTKSPEMRNEKFDVNIGMDYSLLVEFLKT